MWMRASDADRRITKVAKAFAASQAEGLFTLATEKLDAALPPSMVYWRSFAGRYLTELCHAPQAEHETIPAPDAAELDALVLSAPPMQGAEYLSGDALADVWSDLDAWVRAEGAAFDGGLPAFLKRRAPLWHQVGRVCFHLAENRRDPEYPFAFLATYAPTVTSSSRVQYQPLSNALRQYGGRQDKKTLINLLSPVHFASQRSDFARELIESGDIYQPLAWTPRQAYRFLKEVPLLEESGILVRLPDWWKKRPRPRVGVTIGDDRQKRFDAEGMLDFKVQLALGRRRTDRGRMARADGGRRRAGAAARAMGRGRPRELAGSARPLETGGSQAADGVSFVEGMRLLAGVPADLADDGARADERREWSFVQAGHWLGKLLANLRSPEQLQAARPGEKLESDTCGSTRRRASIGCRFSRALGLGACLADDMGLGKTIQVLALLVAVKQQTRKRNQKPSLLVLPASLLANWKAEIEKFAPSLNAVFVHPSETPEDNLKRMAKRAG